MHARRQRCGAMYQIGEAAAGRRRRITHQFKCAPLVALGLYCVCRLCISGGNLGRGTGAGEALNRRQWAGGRGSRKLEGRRLHAKATGTK
jgi:hypothetical protein